MKAYPEEAVKQFHNKPVVSHPNNQVRNRDENNKIMYQSIRGFVNGDGAKFLSYLFTGHQN